MKKLISSVFVIIALCCSVISNSASAGITDGLVAYFPFNGDANDASGNALHGNLISGGYAHDRFDNEDSALLGYVEIPDNDLLDFTDAFTLSAWLKLEAVESAFNCWMGKDYTTAFATGIKSGGSGDCPAADSVERFMRLYIGDSIILFDAATNFSCGTNTWYHVAVTFDDASDTAQLFVNGVLEHARSHTSTITANDYPLGIGRDGRHGDTFTGRIDNVRIYDRVLTSDEIEELFNFVEPIGPGDGDDDDDGSGGSFSCFITSAK